MNRLRVDETPWWPAAALLAVGVLMCAAAYALPRVAEYVDDAHTIEGDQP